MKLALLNSKIGYGYEHDRLLSTVRHKLRLKNNACNVVLQFTVTVHGLQQ